MYKRQVQTYEYFQMIEDRIISFVAEHSRVGKERLKALMHNTKMLTKDPVSYTHLKPAARTMENVPAAGFAALRFCYFITLSIL